MRSCSAGSSVAKILRRGRRGLFFRRLLVVGVVRMSLAWLLWDFFFGVCDALLDAGMHGQEERLVVPEEPQKCVLHGPAGESASGCD
jgi:hypothetical protein